MVLFYVHGELVKAHNTTTLCQVAADHTATCGQLFQLSFRGFY